MRDIEVKASANYRVRIGENLLPKIAEEIAAIQTSCKVAIISDSTVWPLYGKIVEESLGENGFQVIHYAFPAGEASKNGETYLNILKELSPFPVCRP